MLQSYYKSHVYKRGLQSREDYGGHSNQDTMREDLHTMYATHYMLCTADLEDQHCT